MFLTWLYHPKIAIQTLDEAKAADIEYIWFQPEHI